MRPTQRSAVLRASRTRVGYCVRPARGSATACVPHEGRLLRASRTRVGYCVGPFYALFRAAPSRSAVRVGWQRRQGVQLGLVQGDVGRGGVSGDLRCSFSANDD